MIETISHVFKVARIACDLDTEKLTEACLRVLSVIGVHGLCRENPLQYDHMQKLFVVYLSKARHHKVEETLRLTFTAYG